MRARLLLFMGVALAQLAALAWMIAAHERVLRAGEPFRFRVAPIDPRDPFRGEYVALGFEAERGAWAVARPGGIASGEERAFALLGTDADGFARIRALLPERPAQGAYVAVEYAAWSNDTVHRVRLPFDRFWLEEGDGARTEALLRPRWEEGADAEPLPAHALVRVLGGRAVIEDLVVGGHPIRAWLQATPEQAEAWRRAIMPPPSAEGNAPPPSGPS